MSERYTITGVQLGMLTAIPNKEERQKVVDEIVDKQFVGNVNDLSSTKKAPNGCGKDMDGIMVCDGDVLCDECEKEISEIKCEVNSQRKEDEDLPLENHLDARSKAEEENIQRNMTVDVDNHADKCQDCSGRSSRDKNEGSNISNNILPDTIPEQDVPCILCGKNKESHIPCTTNDKVFWCYNNKERVKKWAYQYTPKQEQDVIDEDELELNEETKKLLMDRIECMEEGKVISFKELLKRIRFKKGCGKYITGNFGGQHCGNVTKYHGQILCDECNSQDNHEQSSEPTGLNSSDD